jgi:2-iminobutanoate/2-iminopropanoate deaminase
MKYGEIPPPLGAYSPGVWAGNLLFMTGVCGEDPHSGELVGGGDIAAETRQAMDNAASLLSAEGMTFDDVVNARIYMTNMDDFADMNSAYKEYFDGQYPARATLEVSRLVGGAHIEIVFTAYRPD